LSKRLSEILQEVSEEYGFHIIAHEIMPDHIHMLVEAPPSIPPKNIPAIFKQKSSSKLRKEFPKFIKRYIWKPNTLWAVGYYIASVGDGVTSEMVKEYINNQK